MINDNLKQLYTKMYLKLSKEGKNLDEIYNEIEDHCSFDSELWDLSEDEGDIHEAYCNAMYSFLEELNKE